MCATLLEKVPRDVIYERAFTVQHCEQRLDCYCVLSNIDAAHVFSISFVKGDMERGGVWREWESNCKNVFERRVA